MCVSALSNVTLLEHPKMVLNSRPSSLSILCFHVSSAGNCDCSRKFSKCLCLCLKTPQMIVTCHKKPENLVVRAKVQRVAVLEMIHCLISCKLAGLRVLQTGVLQIVVSLSSSCVNLCKLVVRPKWTHHGLLAHWAHRSINYTKKILNKILKKLTKYKPNLSPKLYALRKITAWKFNKMWNFVGSPHFVRSLKSII